MAAFDPGPLNADIKKLQELVPKLIRSPEDILHAIETWVRVSTDPKIKISWMLLKALGLKINDVIKDIMKLAEDALAAVGAPITMGMNAFKWTDVRDQGEEVARNLSNDVLKVDNRWTGQASKNYAAAVTGQTAAVDRVTATADTLSGNLLKAAAAGALFYAGVSGILLSLIQVIDLSIAAMLSGEFSWAGLLALLGGALGSRAAWLAALSTLTTFLGNEVLTLNTLKGQLNSGKGFGGGAGGRWPDPVTGEYSDATVKDKTNNWSVVP